MRLDVHQPRVREIVEWSGPRRQGEPTKLRIASEWPRATDPGAGVEPFEVTSSSNRKYRPAATLVAPSPAR